MYSSINLIFYSEGGVTFEDDVKSIIIESNTTFKELNSLKLTLSAIKNPQNHIILIAKSKEFLNTIEDIASICHNFQNRVFVVYSSPEIIDCFFDNSCMYNQLDTLKKFIHDSIQAQNIYPQHQTSTLLNKLISLELGNLEISCKYIGFNYLIDVVSSALSTKFYSDNYIDLFKHIANISLSSIDTIERNVRHMLLTTWKKSCKFREILKPYTPPKTNAKNILNSLITYLKNII
ncbi:MAG: hypothetical protein IJ371_03830 [Clostridia bacterium]|nr:hypothetical protein [Clostridia bacterium]